MKIDFKQEVMKRQNELLSDLESLIQINSELTSFDPSRLGEPFGSGPRQSLDKMLEIGQRDGFNVLNVDGYAGHIEYGNQSEYVAILGHLDVVPAGNDWTFPPYELTNHDGKLYGRGVEDDKGPTIAAYYAMKILKELNLPLSKRIKLIVGTDEESGSRCVSHYFKKHPEQPVSGFVPDADFPLIYAEKGILRVDISGILKNNEIVQVESGFRSNMVPDYLNAVFNGNYVSQIIDFDANLSPKFENNQTFVRMYGKSAHGSTPELGENAVFKFSKLLKHLNINNTFSMVLDSLFEDDTKGKKLGISTKCDETGELTLNLGILSYKFNELLITLDIRYPKGITYPQIVNQINEKTNSFGLFVTRTSNSDMLYVDPKSSLVQILMNSYIKHTKDFNAKPIVIGGGTFARGVNNVLAFGPHFPGKPSFIHQRDEYILLEDLLLATTIYLEALYELSK